MGFQLPTSTGYSSRITEQSTLWPFWFLWILEMIFLGMGRYKNQQSKPLLWIHLWHRKENTQVPSLKVTSNAPENRLFAPERKRVLLFQLSIFRCKPFVSRSVNTENNTEEHRNFWCVAPFLGSTHVWIPMLLQFLCFVFTAPKLRTGLPFFFFGWVNNIILQSWQFWLLNLNFLGWWKRDQGWRH